MSYRKVWTMAASDYVDEALAALGGEDSDFLLTGKDIGPNGAPAIVLSCRIGGCEWGEFVGQMQLWEFITEAREHWESVHRSVQKCR